MKFSFNYRSSKPAKPLKKWQQILIGVLFTFIGGFMLVVSVNQINDYKKKDKIFTPITATVVGYDTNSDGLQAVIVEYAVGTTIYREKSDTYSNMPKEMGTRIDIKYNPNNPNDIIWVGDSANFILPLTSVIFIVCGFLICIGGAKKKEEQLLEAPVEQELPPSVKAQMAGVQVAETPTATPEVMPKPVQEVTPAMTNLQENVENSTSNINN